MISGNNRYVIFQCDATNLDPPDSNSRRDVFILDRELCLAPSVTTGPQSQTVFVGQSFSLTVQSSGTPNLHYQWSKDGDEILGATDEELSFAAATLEDAGVYTVAVSNGCGTFSPPAAVIEVDGCLPVSEMASVGNGGANVLGDSGGAVLSADGRYIAFHGSISFLVPVGYGNNHTHVYVKDRHTERVVGISARPDGLGGNAQSSFPSISASGRFIAFQSQATDLVPGDSNGVVDVFLRDRDPDEDGDFFNGSAATILVSRNSAGDLANAGCGGAAVSADGRFVAFSSGALNLAAPPSSVEQIYVRETMTGQTTRVSVNNLGEAAIDECKYPAVSGDGRYVAFWSRANNLDPADNNIYPDIFVHDRLTAATTLVCVDSNGTSVSGEAGALSISADGRYVAFVTGAPLDPIDQNATFDIYVRDRQSLQTTRASLGIGGADSNGLSTQPSISNDGRFVSFSSIATNLVISDTNGMRDVFVRDRMLNFTIRLSESGNGVAGNDDSGNGSIVSLGAPVSADGTHVAFASLASNLIDHDLNDDSDIFVRNLPLGQLFRASGSSSGVSGSGVATQGSVSADGRYVAFDSTSSNLVANDTNGTSDIFLRDRYATTTLRINLSPTGQETPSVSQSGAARISADGLYILYFSSANNLVSGANSWAQVYVYDMALNSTVVVSKSGTGQLSNNDSGSMFNGQAISANGRFIAFRSSATNLVSGDTNGIVDVFLRDRDPDENGIFDDTPGTTTRMNVTSAGQQVFGSDATEPAISGDGRIIAFQSLSGTLVPNDTNNRIDIFVRDRLSGQTQRVSVNSAGVQSNEDSLKPSVSFDGRFVAFSSNATNLDPNDSNQFYSDIYVRDRVNATTFVVSVGATDVAGNDHSTLPMISSDGTLVAFQSSATNLVPGDSNAKTDVFVRDNLAGTTARLSVGPVGQQSNMHCSRPAISGDGTVVVFESQTSALTPETSNHGTNIIVHERPFCGGPILYTGPQPQMVPAGTPARFDVVAAANPTPRFQWRKNAQPIFGATSETLIIDFAGLSDVGEYDVVISNDLGSITSEEVILDVLLLGDLNCDGAADILDVDAFALGLVDAAAYAQAYPNCPIARADVNGDTVIDGFDIPSFVEMLVAP